MSRTLLVPDFPNFSVERMAAGGSRRFGRLVPAAIAHLCVRRHRMRSLTKIIAVVLVVIVVGYEAAFRICTAKWGEVDMQSKPPRVYYSADLMLPFPVLRFCFGFRTELPLGRVSLSEGSRASVDGGRFYWGMPDGSWRDVTDDMIEYQKQKSKP